MSIQEFTDNSIHKKRMMKYFIAPTRNEIVARKVCDLIFDVKKVNPTKIVEALQEVVTYFKRQGDNGLVDAIKTEVEQCHPYLVSQIKW